VINIINFGLTFRKHLPLMMDADRMNIEWPFLLGERRWLKSLNLIVERNIAQ